MFIIYLACFIIVLPLFLSIIDVLLSFGLFLIDLVLPAIKQPNDIQEDTSDCG